MFQNLDKTLKALLNDGAIDADFRTPEKGYKPPDENPPDPHEKNKAVNLFLYDVKENRALRDPMPSVIQGSNEYTKKMPPLRLDCSYLVTAWSDDDGELKVKKEHELLALVLARLSSFPTIPETYLDPNITGGLSGQIYAPPTMVAQLDGGRNMGEFWTALGIPPRPYFNLVVTITMDLNIEQSAGPPVTTHEIRIRKKTDTGTDPLLDVNFEIVGTVRSSNTGNGIGNASVMIVELTRNTQTDAEGRYRFPGVDAGNYTLRTTKAGYSAPDVPIAVPPVPGTGPNSYDIDMTP